jgi:hypothetical protein
MDFVSIRITEKYVHFCSFELRGPGTFNTDGNVNRYTAADAQIPSGRRAVVRNTAIAVCIPSSPTRQPLTAIDFANTPVSLMPCPPSAPGVWQWWCGNDYQNVCGKPNDKTTIFDYPENGFISAIAGNETIEAVASPPSSTAGVGSVSTGTSINTPLTDSCTSAEPNVQGSKKPGVSTSVPIAIGVAIGVPLALLSLTFGILYQRERKRRVLAEQLGFAGQGYTGQKAFNVESKPVYELGSDPPQLDGSPISK